MPDPSTTDPWQQGDPYEAYVGRWSRKVAAIFVDWLSVPHDRRWLDVGSGTGALSETIVDADPTAIVTGVEPSDGFRAAAVARLGHRATFHAGHAAALPIDDGSVDTVVSGLVLNFVPHVAAALFEMRRVTVVGGVIAAYVWDYAGRMDLMRTFWDAAISLDASAAPSSEATRFPLCRPEALTACFDRAGLQRVDVRPIAIATPFDDFDAYWRPFLGGQGPAPAYAMSLDEASRERLRERLRSQVEERFALDENGRIAMTARVWAVRGEVASR